MLVLVLLSINDYTRFEVPSLTHSKDMIGVAKFKKRATPIVGQFVIPMVRVDKPTYVQNLMTLVPAVPEI